MTTFHPRIHPANYPILEKYGKEHPAVRALNLHAEARDVCVGKEIKWKDGNRAIDQTWFSIVDQRTWTFSGFAYAFISFDLVLHGWLVDGSNSLEPFEEDFLHELPRLRKLLDECEMAACDDRNESIQPLLEKADEFLQAYEESIVWRTGRVKVEDDDRYVESLWGAGRCDRFS